MTVLRELLPLVLIAGLAAVVIAVLVWIRKRRGLFPAEPANLLWLDTRRHSAVLREVLTVYGPEARITIDSHDFGPADLPILLKEWCTNRRIHATQHFEMAKGNTLLFGWGCSYRDFWANATEQHFVERLEAKGLLRAHHVGSGARA